MFLSVRAQRTFFSLLTVPCLFAIAISAQENDWKARDAWEKPQEVMDALGIHQGSVVADVGAGDGYFTLHIAKRVGPTGKVYGEDILDDRLAKIRTNAKREKLPQIETIHGEMDDPRLPEARVDVVLISNAYHEFREYDKMLGAISRSLKPGGLLGIIDSPAESGEARENYYSRHRIPEKLVREDAARNGFEFVRQMPTMASTETERNYYFVIFRKVETELKK